MVFYFTGTGNSQMVAECIAGDIGESVRSLTALDKLGFYAVSLDPDETLGIVAPTYYYGIPIHLPALLQKLHFDRVPGYVWTCLTCEGMTGAAGRQLAGALAEAGLEVNGQFSCPVVNNSVVMGGQQPVRFVDRLLDRAESVAHSIADKVRKRREGDFDDLKGFAAAQTTAAYYPAYEKGRETRRFWTDGCIGCGKCAEDCPAGAITLAQGKAEWTLPRCYYCLHCINACPQNAIHFAKADHRSQYINPRVKGAI